MPRFLQLHLLTVYPPANLNRDDTGRPKTAEFGGCTRLRVSSQALKRAWRTSELFRARLQGRLGERTQRLGTEVEQHLLEKGVEAAAARGVARRVADVFGAVEAENDKNPTYTKQLAFVSPQERAAALVLADRLAAGEAVEAKAATASVLRTSDTAVDIAMFGRMLADDPAYNREAAVQVAHAITTHRVTVEDDYYTAVDDLKRPSEDAGAGFIGEAGFASGVFYLYACVDRDLLVRNLGGDGELAASGVAALVEAAATTAPKGKQASFASRARAHFLLAEAGDAGPRTLAGAFVQPVAGTNILADSVGVLQDTCRLFAQAYGDPLDRQAVMDVGAGAGSLREIVAFARDAVLG